jgi:nitrite reductase (NADH) small subunit
MAFVRVAAADEIPVGRGAFVASGGLTLALFNAGGGRFYACGALCPHEDGPLSEGWLEGTAAVCPWHGFDFDLETGRCLVNPDLSVSVYAVRVSDGGIEVDLP